MRWAAIILAGLAALAPACSDTSRPSVSATPVTTTTVPTSMTSGLTGRVFDVLNDRGIPNVVMTWSPLPSGGAVTTQTDQTGTYRVKLPPAERVSVAIPGGGTTAMVGDGSVPIDFLQNTSGCPTLYGYVFNSVTKRPLSGARVGWVGSTLTDANGQYRFNLECRQPLGYGTGTTVLGFAHDAYTPYNVVPYARSESLGSPGLWRMDVVMTPK
jgi:hypothetical protein